MASVAPPASPRVLAAAFRLPVSQAAGPLTQAQVAAESAMAPLPISTACSDMPSPAGFAQEFASLVLPTPGSEPADRAAPAHARETPTAVRVVTAPEPVRVHVEWGSDGVRLWLGLSAEALSQQQWIAQQLRHWVASQGGRVAALFCNGQQMDVAETEVKALRSDCGVHLGFDNEEKTCLSVP